MTVHNDNNRRNPHFIAWSDQVEKVMKRVIIGLTILLVTTQFILQFPIVRQWITTTDHSEGIPFHYHSH
jgi:hypothetical protein